MRCIAALSLQMIAGLLVTGLSARAEAQAIASQRVVNITVRPAGSLQPTSVDGPTGTPMQKTGTQFRASIPAPQSDILFYDVSVNYDFGSYPLRIRIHPLSEDVQVVVSIEKPKSCADVYLKPLEKPTMTTPSSVRAAFMLGFLIDGRAGPNSCEHWEYRASKARFDRYYNAMERSGFLLIPDGVKEALKQAAKTQNDRRNAEGLIAKSNLAEKQRLAILLQSTVVGAAARQNFAKAHTASQVLLETAAKPEFAAAVASQIDPSVLRKQTQDLAERAASDTEVQAPH